MGDTIAAISTALGEGGIGIVRLSGPKAIAITDQLYRGRKPLGEVEAGRIVYGKIVQNGETIDEVLVSIFRAPFSYTREDVVEINCHGGVAVTRRILQAVLDGGARLAEPGEFTKRAFLNGRIDLAQAEAVIDVIRSKTDLTLRNAVRQLTGRLSNVIRPVRDRLIDAIAQIEAAIDYPDDDIDILDRPELESAIGVSIADLERVVATADIGKVLSEGIACAIVGRPNAGKSSLLNQLLREERALVTDVPGTTRDVIEETVNINGVPLRLLDTAGIRQTKDVVENLGVERAKTSISEADVILFVVDGSAPLTEEDRMIASMLQGKEVLGVVNKIDRSRRVTDEELEGLLPGIKWVGISALTGEKIDVMENALLDLVGVGKIDASLDAVIVTRERHRQSLNKAISSLKDALHTLSMDMPYDLVSIDLQQAAEYLGEITGETVKEDVLDRIFSRFCIGK